MYLLQYYYPRGFGVRKTRDETLAPSLLSFMVQDQLISLGLTFPTYKMEIMLNSQNKIGFNQVMYAKYLAQLWV